MQARTPRQASLPKAFTMSACDKAGLPAPARKALNMLADQLIDSQKKIEALTADIRADASASEAAQRLQIRAGPENDPGDRFPGDWPGIGPITASALISTLPDIADFKSGRDLVRGKNCPPDSFLLPLTLAGFDTEAPLDRRQGKAGTHRRDGQQVSAATALSRRDRAGQRPPSW